MTGSSFFFASGAETTVLLTIPNLVAHWTFDEGTGTNVSDATGGGRTGTAFGSPTWGTGKFGSCMNFDGTNDYVSVASHTSLNFGASQDFTVSLWLKTSTAATFNKWPQVVTKNDSGNQNDWNMFLSESTETNQWGFNVRVLGTKYQIFSGSSIRDGSWHHLVGQREGTTIRIYQDNSDVDSLTNAAISGSLSNTNILSFGRLTAASPSWFTGSIDDCRIYNRALTTTEISALYNGTVA